MSKYVVSSTLRKAEWNNTSVISGDPVAHITRLKQEPGKDIVQYGFGRLSYTLMHQAFEYLIAAPIYGAIIGAVYRPPVAR